MQYYVYGLYKKNFKKTTFKLDDGLFYIGITTSKNIKNRKQDHRKSRWNDRNPRKFHVVKKYDFDMMVLFSFDTREESEEMETFLIKWFGILEDGGPLTNLCRTPQEAIQRAQARTNRETHKRGADGRREYYKIQANRDKKRDEGLSKPYDQVIVWLDDWARNPLITHTQYAKNIGVSRIVFNNWLRLYRPEYINLPKRYKESIYSEMVAMEEEGMKKRDIFKVIDEKYKLNAKSLYQFHQYESKTRGQKKNDA